MDPHNSHVLFAGMWQVEMHTYGEYSGGPGSGVYVSRDGGTKWTKIEGRGMPRPNVGKIDVAVAPTDSLPLKALHPGGDVEGVAGMHDLKFDPVVEGRPVSKAGDIVIHQARRQLIVHCGGDKRFDTGAPFAVGQPGNSDE